MSDKSTQTSKYPLMDHAGDILQTAGGRALTEVTLEAAISGTLSADDLKIHADTLHAQADIARQAGYPQLAQNLTRAAELTAVPNETLLEMYEMLRPHRLSYDGLLALADTLETTYKAPVNAQFVREAAAAYQSRGLLKRE